MYSRVWQGLLFSSFLRFSFFLSFVVSLFLSFLPKHTQNPFNLGFYGSLLLFFLLSSVRSFVLIFFAPSLRLSCVTENWKQVFGSNPLAVFLPALLSPPNPTGGWDFPVSPSFMLTQKIATAV
jgi:hypothetical protein